MPAKFTLLPTLTGKGRPFAESIKSFNKPIHRALFHELTKKASIEALAHATLINHHLFEAQQARRILDRLVGYQISPLLWEKVRRGLSAGRVQSVAVRMVCEREEAIKNFVSEEYWSIAVRLQAALPPQFVAQLEKKEGKKAKIANQDEADIICRDLNAASYIVQRTEKKQKKRFPSPPFITSTMQIEANRKLRFPAKKTMSLAQRLYEGIELGSEGPTGLITYMRTDSIRINDDALKELREFIGRTYGTAYLPAKPFLYKTNKSAQDAHEAIRPTDASKTPEMVAPFLDKNMLALYTLIWKRFVASQMAAAVYDQTTIQIQADKYELKAVGSILRFAGFISLYQEDSDDTGSQEAAKGEAAALPDISDGEVLAKKEVKPKQHFTQPPPRYTEATLVKALEENGVGRPSTYASIISTIQDKEYVRLEQRRFSPTELGQLITGLLVEHFPKIMEIEFTASMEQDLDKIAEGRIPWLKVMQDFYSPFQQALIKAKKEMQSVKRSVVPTDIICERCGAKMVIRWGKMGEFLACEKFPECKNTRDFRRDEEGNIQPIDKEEPEPSNELCEKCGKPMVYRNGRFGRFLACSGYPKCKNIRALAIGVPCPEADCDGEIIQKISKRGKIFYSCNRYPKCKLALWDKPINVPCPQCGAPYLLEKDSKALGLHLKCANKDCEYIEKIVKKQKDE
ncbi:MAG: type I DNA topoisomerase [Deltaproteobacteria bacterium]